jgi:hypothetical protein
VVRGARRGETRPGRRRGGGGLPCWAAREAGPEEGRVEEEKERVLHLQKRHKQMNSNSNLNSNNQRQCTSMNAIINSYSSFFRKVLNA